LLEAESPRRINHARRKPHIYASDFTRLTCVLLNHLQQPLELNHLYSYSDTLFDAKYCYLKGPKVLYLKTLLTTHEELWEAGLESMKDLHHVVIQITAKTLDSSSQGTQHFEIMASATCKNESGSILKAINVLAMPTDFDMRFGLGCNVTIRVPQFEIFNKAWLGMSFNQMLMLLKYHSKIVFDKYGEERTVEDKAKIKRMFGSKWAYVRVGKALYGATI
jgi:hypothetical protein